MSDMIEKVARAICARHYSERFRLPPAHKHVQANVDGNWFVFAEDARAAIEAMREPTGAMNLAFHEAINAWLSEDAEEDEFASDNRVWQAMIRAALSQDTHSLPLEDR